MRTEHFLGYQQKNNWSIFGSIQENILMKIEGNEFKFIATKSPYGYRLKTPSKLA